MSRTFTSNPSKAGLATAVLIHGLLCIASASEAAGLGDIDAGLKYAKERCAECHNITSRNPVKTASGAPTFHAIANTSGSSWTKLSFWMLSSHPKMPGLMIEDQDLDNVITYILSLKDN